MTVSLITVGGGRPEAFALCETYMKRQTYKGSLQWIVVDDNPADPIKCTMGQELYLGPLTWRKGINTQRYNLAYGLSKVKGDFVFIIENDDWYAPSYLDVYLSFLKHTAAVGECNTVYYSLKERSYRYMRNYKHASTCQTAFRKGSIPFFENALHSGDLYFDITFWQKALGNNIRHILFHGMGLCVGIKGMPGRDGIGVGHRPSNFTPDEKGTVLSTLIGLDAKLYKPYLGVMP